MIRYLSVSSRILPFDGFFEAYELSRYKFFTFNACYWHSRIICLGGNRVKSGIGRVLESRDLHGTGGSQVGLV